MVAAVVAVGSAVAGAAAQNSASRRAANAQQQSTDATIAEQRRQYDQTRADQAPWLAAGGRALAQQEALNRGDFSSFTESPDYAFARDQGLKGLNRGAAAQGGRLSGGADADRIAFASGLASQNYNNYYNRLAGLSGTGQNTAQSLGVLGANAANAIGNANTAAGNARASAYTDQGNAWGNALSQIGTIGGNALGQRNNFSGMTPVDAGLPSGTIGGVRVRR